MIKIRDSGSGIESEDLNHIFERFYRKADHRPSDSSSGLGLPIARKIIEKHGGTLKVESIVNKGTIIQVEIMYSPVL